MRRGPRSGGYSEVEMDYIVAGVVALCLFVYLVYALLRPERF
ncbi:MAG: K(+)-transporting ATPase subunit F [Acidobacteriia bacterium]|nr:K(+)-transporting ATPase subunit F [Terriglobia bacterium]